MASGPPSCGGPGSASAPARLWRRMPTSPSHSSTPRRSSRSLPVTDRGLTDQPDRDRIVDALDETLFVEAGAGSGKTTALVDRVVALVVDGVELAAIAAITFTEKTAAELRDRVRRALQESATT